MFLRVLFLSLFLVLPPQLTSAASFSVFDAYPTALVVESADYSLELSLQQQLKSRYEWAFRLPVYDKRDAGGFIKRQPGEQFFLNNKGVVNLTTVQAYMGSNSLQRLVILRVDDLSAFVYHGFSDEAEFADLQVRGNAVVVDANGKILFQLKIRRWEQVELGADNGVEALLIEEWEHFLSKTKMIKN